MEWNLETPRSSSSNWRPGTPDLQLEEEQENQTRALPPIAENANRAAWFAAGLAVGVFAALLFDPISGRRRRALVKDQGVHLAHMASRLANRKLRDAGHRAKGAVMRARQAAHRFDIVEDSVLEERVRSHLGHEIDHPRKIDVSARHGDVTLRGTVSKKEIRPLLACVRSVPGVRRVINMVDVTGGFFQFASSSAQRPIAAGVGV